MQYFTVGEPLILIYITKYNKDWGGPKPSVESGWKISRERAQKYLLILARDNDKIVGAYRPVEGSWRRGDATWKPDRWFFKVERANNVWSDYVGKLVPPGLIGRYNRPVIRYVDPEY